ncbi:MAG: diguanylate cyclase domain-containing protein [Acidimicrobiales bacterium]
MSPEDASIDETLQLARDLCIGVGAFFATPAGVVRSTLSEVMAPEDGARRVEQLARACLIHPAVNGRALFWNAEVTTEAESADRSLACVAAPVWSNGTWLGVLGVADLWLPELDDEQRAGLVALAGSLARRLRAIRTELADSAPAMPPDRPRPHEAEPKVEVPPTQPVTDRSSRPAAAPATGAPEGPSEPFLGEVLDSLPYGLLVTRSDGAIVLANQTFSSMTDLPIDDVLGEDVTRIFSTETPAPAGERVDVLASLLGRSTLDRHLLVARREGDPLVVEASGRRLSSRYAGDCFVTLVRGARSTGGPGRPEWGTPIEELLDSLDDGIVSCDANGVVVLANQAARRLHGLPPDRPLIGLPFPASTGLRTTAGAPLGTDAHPLLRALREGSSASAHVLLRTSGDEVTRHVSVAARSLGNGGGGGAIAVLRDVTSEWQEQEQLAHYALHDPLTGLANRYLLAEELGRMLQGLARRAGSVALVFLDLDGFKDVNDTYGHEVGDEVLKAVARRLQGAVRSDDVVARLGGDEFVVAHMTSGRTSDGDMVVARIRKVLSAPYRFGGRVFDIGVSAGWVGTTSSETGPEGLLNQADQAMYRDKRNRGTAAQGGRS